MTKRSYKIGHGRQQVSLLPPCVADYVGRDNPVRAIDTDVDRLDLNEPDFWISDLMAVPASRLLALATEPRRLSGLATAICRAFQTFKIAPLRYTFAP